MRLPLIIICICTRQTQTHSAALVDRFIKSDQKKNKLPIPNRPRELNVSNHLLTNSIFKNRSTANQSLTENLEPNGRIGRRTQKLSTITN